MLLLVSYYIIKTKFTGYSSFKINVNITNTLNIPSGYKHLQNISACYQVSAELDYCSDQPDLSTDAPQQNDEFPKKL